MPLDPQQSVATVVLDHSECAQVFQKHRIDFCCRGDLSLASAAREKGLGLDVLLSELGKAIESREGPAGEDPRTLPTKELIGHIVSKHHAYMRETLPFLHSLATKVSRVHGTHNLKLPALETAVHELVNSLGPHLFEEEGNLFPALIAQKPDEEVLPQLDAMACEHNAVAKILERIESASDGYTVPEWGCNSYRALIRELVAVRDDIHRHVHLENHVLMPRFTGNL